MGVCIMYVDAVVGSKCIMVERDEMNRGTSSLPPVLPKDLLGFTRAQFGDLLVEQKLRLSESLTAGQIIDLERELKRGLRERIIQHVIVGGKGKELEDEVVLEGINQSQVHVIQDESTIGSEKVAFSAFVRVVSSPLLPQQSKIDQLIGNPQCIVESMNKMHRGKREKGNKEGVYKFQTLNGRYFLKKNHNYGANMTSVEDSIFIKRGSIVSLDNCKHRKCMITVVWKANGSNKNSKYFQILHVYIPTSRSTKVLQSISALSKEEKTNIVQWIKSQPLIDLQTKIYFKH